MGLDFVMNIAVVLSIAMALVIATGAILVVRDTIRKRGRWGINLRPVFCPECGEPAPVVRRPKNWRQALWGGCTCEACGTEYDKWGESIPGPSRFEVVPGTSSPSGGEEE